MKEKLKTKRNKKQYGTDVVHIRLDPLLISTLSDRARSEGFQLTPWLKAKLLKAVGAI